MFVYVNTFFNVVSLHQRTADYAGRHVAGKPTIRAPLFGKWLKARRGEHRTLESVAMKVRSALSGFGVRFHRSQLLKIEETGSVPHVLVLHQLAHIYRVPTGAVIDQIATELGLRSARAPGLPADPLPSDEALAVARWYDTLPVERRRSVLVAFDINPVIGNEETRAATHARERFRAKDKPQP